jgi:tetrahydromethanopterin S-methyltransferase subunit G
LKPQTWQKSKKRTDKLTERLEAVQKAVTELKALRMENPDDIERSIENIVGELPVIGSVPFSYGVK